MPSRFWESDILHDISLIPILGLIGISPSRTSYGNSKGLLNTCLELTLIYTNAAVF